MRTLIMLAMVMLVSVNDISAQEFRKGPGQEAEALKTQIASENTAKPADQMRNPLTVPNPGTMSRKEKADVFLDLTRLAVERYDQIAAINWKLRLAVWTAFGLGAWFVLLSEKWRPRKIECILASLIALGGAVTVIFIWGPNQYERISRWSRVAHYWESAVQHTVEARLPDHLHPAYRGTGGWVRYKEEQIPDKQQLPWYKSLVYISHSLVTGLFALLFIGAILSRTDWRSGRKKKKASRKDES